MKTMDTQTMLEYRSVGLTRFTSRSYKPGILRHIVLFRYRDNITPQQAETVRQRFLALKDEAQRDGRPYIVKLETGSQISGEEAGHGYHQGFIVTFISQGDRNYYVGTPVVRDPAYYDPAHQRFKDFVAPYLAKENGVLVFDLQAGQ